MGGKPRGAGDEGLGMRTTLGDWPLHPSARMSPTLSLVPEPVLRETVAEEERALPPRWTQNPTESGSAALPMMS